MVHEDDTRVVWKLDSSRPKPLSIWLTWLVKLNQQGVQFKSLTDAIGTDTLRAVSSFMSSSALLNGAGVQM